MFELILSTWTNASQMPLLCSTVHAQIVSQRFDGRTYGRTNATHGDDYSVPLKITIISDHWSRRAMRLSTWKVLSRSAIEARSLNLAWQEKWQSYSAIAWTEMKPNKMFSTNDQVFYSNQQDFAYSHGLVRFCVYLCVCVCLLKSFAQVIPWRKSQT